MNPIQTRTIVAAVCYIAALAIIATTDLGDRGYFFTPDAALASHGEGEVEAYSLRDLHLLNRSIGYVRNNYVEPDRVSPAQMLTGAIEAIQRRIPEVVVKERIVEDVPLAQATIQVGGEERVFDLRAIEDVYKMTWIAKDIVAFLDLNLPKRVTRADVEYAAVNGMLDTLDPHSILLNPTTYAEMQVGTRGKFGGLGIVVSAQNGELVVLTVLPGTPAAKAGLQNQDSITQIENESTLNMALDDAVNRLRGEVKTSVTIWIHREGWEEPRPFTIQREEIRIQAIQSSDLQRGVGYIRIKNFQQNTQEELDQAISELEEKGALRNGLVLDLRNNPGGLLDQAVSVSDRFLSDGTIVTTVGGSARVREEKKATRKNSLNDIPILILVNNGSASASEIVTGALKNNGRALVMGETTFGKGTVQVLYEIEDPRDKTAALKLTIAQYLTPGDKSIQSVGIVPDIELFEASIQDDFIHLSREGNSPREETLSNHLKSSGSETSNGPKAFLRYVEPPDEEEIQNAEDETPEIVNPFGDVEVDYPILLARDILVHHTEVKRKAESLFASSATVLNREATREDQEISEELQALGIRWNPAAKTPSEATAKALKATLSSTRSERKIWAGEELELELTVQNTGNTVVHNIRAESESAYGRFNGLEWVLGSIPAGGKRSWTTKIPLPRNSMARDVDVQARLFSGDFPIATPEVETSIQVEPLPRPTFAFTTYLDDSKGNGDGLLQPGETIQLSLKLENVGEGKAFKTRAYIRNLSGEKVFLEKGRGSLESLNPGASATLNYEFRLDPKAKGSAVDLEVEITDTVLRSTLSTPLRIPIHPVAVENSSKEEVTWFTAETTPMYSGASDGSPVLARLSKGIPFPATRRLGSWLRGPLPEEKGVGWIHERHLSSEPVDEPQDGVQIELMKTAVAPRIDLPEKWSDSMRTSEDTYLLEGSAVFQSMQVGQTTQFYVFNDDQKIHYQEDTVGEAGIPSILPFTVSVPLREGSNLLVLYGRQGEDIVTRRHLVVTREPSQK